MPIRNSIRYLTASYPFSASYSQNFTSAAQSPDGLPNFLLRNPLTRVTGVNTGDVVNSNSTNALLPGISTGTVPAAKYPPARVQEANFTIEQPLKDGSVFRASYVFTHGESLDQNFVFNNAPSTYVWQTATGTALPTGRFAGAATRPYDQQTWGNITQSTKFGFSNDSALQLNYQRPFRNGIGYQVFYVYSRAFRVGGNTFRDNTLYPAANYAPGTIPQGMDVGTQFEPSREFNRWQNYRPDAAIPLICGGAGRGGDQHGLAGDGHDRDPVVHWPWRPGPKGRVVRRSSSTTSPIPPSRRRPRRWIKTRRASIMDSSPLFASPRLLTTEKPYRRDDRFKG